MVLGQDKVRTNQSAAEASNYYLFRGKLKQNFLQDKYITTFCELDTEFIN